MITHEVSNGCRCAEPRRSNSYHLGHASQTCNWCARMIVEQSWHLTADGLRQFLTSAGEGTPDLSHDQLTHFASEVIPRVMEQGAKDYGLHGFLHRDLRLDPQQELLDTAAYCYFQVLQDRWLVEQGEMDPEHASERERHLMNLAAETIRLHEAFRFFWQNL